MTDVDLTRWTDAMLGRCARVATSEHDRPAGRRLERRGFAPRDEPIYIFEHRGAWHEVPLAEAEAVVSTLTTNAPAFEVAPAVEFVVLRRRRRSWRELHPWSARCDATEWRELPYGPVEPDLLRVAFGLTVRGTLRRLRRTPREDT